MTKENFVTVMEQLKKFEGYQNKPDETFSLNEEATIEMVNFVTKDYENYELSKEEEKND